MGVALLALAGLMGSTGLAGCGGAGVQAADGKTPDLDRAVGDASIRGTVLDARTGRPVEGAWVELEGGARTATDAAGRFHLRGLAPETSGELRAWTEGAALAGANHVRPLQPGALEVVLFVRPDSRASGTEERPDGR